MSKTLLITLLLCLYFTAEVSGIWGITNVNKRCQEKGKWRARSPMCRAILKKEKGMHWLYVKLMFFRLPSPVSQFVSHPDFTI